MPQFESTPQIVSIQVGMPRERGEPGAEEPMDRPWTSAIFKQPIDGPVHVSRINLAGDGQADLVHHGGLDKAVLAYSADHYDAWRSELGFEEPPWGGFGENLTIRDLTEKKVCIGDVWRAGEVLFQVSQPRQPCWKLGRRWRRAELPKRVVETGRTGWYLRVLAEGSIEAGLAITLEHRPQPGWTVADVSRRMYEKPPNHAAISALADVPELSDDWRNEFARRLK